MKGRDDSAGTVQLRRRRLLQLLSAGGLLPGVLHAQQDVVRMVVPFTPGTTPDLCARLVGPHLQKSLGRVFVTDNRAGASGMIGMDAVAKATPASALLFGTSTMLTLPFVYAKVPFDVLHSFVPVGMIGDTNFALAVHPSVPAKDARELVSWVKAQGAPVDYASPGKGTFQHLTMEWIASLTGIKLNHVPYKGSGPAQADVLGGHVKLMIMPLHVAVPLAADGKLRILGATRRERDTAFPNVPPLHDVGVPGLDADAWYAVWAPKGLSTELAAQYNGALRAALSDAEVQSTLARQGVRVRPGSPAELQTSTQAEYDKWRTLIKAIKLPLE